MNGHAAQSGNVLRVTPATGGQEGSVFHDQAVNVVDGFTTMFTFQFTDLGGGGADGMTIIFHNAAAGLNALGDDGSGMGYAINGVGNVIENSLAIELDTWNSGGNGDIDANHVSIHTGGTGNNSYDESFSLGQVSVPNDMSDGAVHTAVVRYVNGVLAVYVDDLSTPLIAIDWDFVNGGMYANGNAAGGLNLIGGTSAYVGFTAGSGGAWENHDVLSWEWRDADVGSNSCGPANNNSSGGPGVIAASGSEVVGNNDLTLSASALPAGQFAFFVNSQTTGFTANYMGSQGNLCLGGGLGLHQGLVGNTGGAGTYSAAIDLTQVPTPAGPVAVMPGETWSWQCWFRDQNPNRTSNFTDAISITFL